MPALVIKYPVDPTGISPSNLVQGEQCTLNGNKVRVIAPQYGAFFGASVQLTDLSNNYVLIEGTDWYPGQLYDIPTSEFGQGVYGLIVITNPNVSNTVLLNYQVAGGEYSVSSTALVSLINSLNLDARPVAWPDIIRKPATYPPSEHLHDAGDVYGFEYLVHAIERLRDSVEFGSMLANNDVYQYIDGQVANVNATVTAQLAALSAALNAEMASNLAALNAQVVTLAVGTEVTEDIVFFTSGSGN